MNLNPITVLSEQLQRLINEHGSAAILRDHLALFKDQVVIIEKKATLLELENSIFKTENSELKTKIVQLTNENDGLRGKIQNVEQPSVTEMHDRVLDLLFQKPATNEHTCKTLKINEQEAYFYLDDLYNENMVDPPTPYSSGPEEWRLSQDGRRYIMSKRTKA
jgi:hypothetical protein